MTFVALTKLQNREPTLLQTVINNTGGKLHIALREFHYEVGYRNTSSTGGFEFDAPEHIGRIRLSGSLSHILGID